MMEHPIKMDDLGGKPTIFGNIHIYTLKMNECRPKNWGPTICFFKKEMNHLNATIGEFSGDVR